jgi:enterochelin esterase-like enzyme
VEEAVVSRRAFLFGGLAAMGATGIAATQTRTRRLLHSAGLLGVSDGHGAPSPRPRPVVERRTFPSTHLRGEVAYTVARPPGVDGPVPVVYALHGRGEDERFAVESIRFQDFLVDAGVPVAVVAPDGGPSSYWHPRRSGADPLKMLVFELVPRIDAELGGPKPRRGLLGWSMGGYGALLVGERFPDLFRAAALGSPALWRRFRDTAPGAFDGELDFRAHDVFTATDRLDGVALRADIGRDDPFLAGFQDLERFRPDGDFHVGHGFHDAAFWRNVAPAQARFFGKHLLAT